MDKNNRAPELNLTLLISHHSEERCHLMTWPRYPGFESDDTVWDTVVDALTGLEKQRKLTLTHYPLNHELKFEGGAPLDEARLCAEAMAGSLGFTSMREVGGDDGEKVTRFAPQDVD